MSYLNTEFGLAFGVMKPSWARFGVLLGVLAGVSGATAVPWRAGVSSLYWPAFVYVPNRFTGAVPAAGWLGKELSSAIYGF